VGTRCSPSSSAPDTPVHPHARGDEFSVSAFVLFHPGPPPRAWGRGLRGHVPRPPPRSTPTRVGTSIVGCCAKGLCAVHPHARGDESTGGPALLRESGPPPRAWGRDSPTPELPSRIRSTPTRVGTSRCRGNTSPSSAVHPHARGDEKSQRYLSSSLAGPPPRAWGRGILQHLDPTGLRSTPTRVGTR